MLEGFYMGNNNTTQIYIFAKVSSSLAVYG